MIPPQDMEAQGKAIEAGLSAYVDRGPETSHEELALRAHAFSLVRSPFWEHIRSEGLRSQPAMLRGYVGSGSPLNMALARMALASFIEYVEAMAEAHQETQP